MLTAISISLTPVKEPTNPFPVALSDLVEIPTQTPDRYYNYCLSLYLACPFFFSFFPFPFIRYLLYLHSNGIPFLWYPSERLLLHTPHTPAHQTRSEIRLPLPPKYWDSRHVPPLPGFCLTSLLRHRKFICPAQRLLSPFKRPMMTFQYSWNFWRQKLDSWHYSCPPSLSHKCLPPSGWRNYSMSRNWPQTKRRASVEWAAALGATCLGPAPANTEFLGWIFILIFSFLTVNRP